MSPQHKKERIAQLLASGLSAADVKLVVGVSEGYLKRLKEDEEFNALLRAYAAPDSEEAEAVPETQTTSKELEGERLADRYMALEARVVDQLISNAALADTKDLVGILNAVAKQRAAALPAPNINIGVNGSAQITLSLPTNALGADALQLSSNNEVVAVQGRSLVAMDTNGAQALLEKARKERAAPAQQHQEVYHDL